MKDAKGVYRVVVATRYKGPARLFGRPNADTSGDWVALKLRDARQEPHQMGDVVTPLVSVMMESTDDFIYFKNEHHILLTGSRSIADMCGKVRHWRELAQKNDYELFPEDLADHYYALEQRVYAGETAVKEIHPFLRADGRSGWIDNRKYAVHDAHGRVIGLYGVARDITPQIEAVIVQELAASVFAFSSEGIVILDAEGAVVDVNAAMCRGLGLERDSLLGRSLRELKHAADSDETFAGIWAELREAGHWEGEVVTRSLKGAREEMARLSAVRDESGNAHHYIGLYADITKLKQHEAQLERIAHFDQLTGLANRKLLADRLEQALATCGRRGSQLAIAYMDLDGFKQINDNHNHHVGDQFLADIARRLKTALRETDTLARVGGDEFVAVVTDFEDASMLEPVIARLLAAAAAPVTLGTSNKVLNASVSIGVSLYPRDGTDADVLLRRADQAMYMAKHRGKNGAHYYESGGAIDDVCREDLRRAMDDGEISLRYQPTVNLEDGSLECFEALLRWHHPQRGVLNPAEFLPLIERENLSIELGDWVLREAARQADLWHRQGLDCPISVNISGVYLQHGNFLDTLTRLMDAQEAKLQIELLETSAMDDTEAVVGIIEACRRLGVSVSLDDFGTGFSSLTHLRRLPVNTVKIDGSFVQAMLKDREDFSIVSSIVGLCAGLDRKVVAEGVCSADHANALLRVGCDLGQGFAIGRPSPLALQGAWVGQWRNPGQGRNPCAGA
ncbi:MAG: EAL domain-containing protein, partial [Pseudomonadota bacterium]